MTTYMIIEKYKPGKAAEIYKRFSKKGRMLPKGVEYVDSWVEENLEKCYQIMKSDSPEKLKEWIAHWQDLVEFEVIPVLNSTDAAKKLMK